MNRAVLPTVLAVLGLVLAACSGGAPPPAGEAAHDHAGGHAESLYQCPMHPEVTSDKPGECPICGMDLVPVDASAGGSADEGVHLSAAMVNNLGVRTAPVRHGTVGGAVDAVGTVAYDERGRVEVRVRTDGYVERLAVRAEGEAVRRGQALFAVFSPRIAAAQREYLAAASLQEPALVAAAADRLRALGMDRGAIARLEASATATERVTHYAPIDGVVTLLGVREGSLAEPGMSAMTLAPIDPLWVVADIPEAEAGGVAAGARAEIRFPSLPGERFEARVLEVLPELDRATRSVQARISLQNPQGRLAAGMLADVMIDDARSGHGLLVPQEALIRTGRSERVIVALGDGRFAPREVRAGAESGSDIEILEGLRPGEEVVVSGQFMIDSESQVRSGLRRLEEVPPASAQDQRAHEGHTP